MSELHANDRRSWVELARDENRAIWNRVHADLVVDPARPPKFVEPRGSVTWELRDVPESPRHTIDQVEVIVGTQLRLALEGLVGAEQWVYGLDWQHPGYRFFPAEAKNPVNSESWCIPAVPDGDYCLFLADDLRFGWLGHPWEPTICVYGDLLAPMGLFSTTWDGQSSEPVAGDANDAGVGNASRQ